jgi:hypothetical protein
MKRSQFTLRICQNEGTACQEAMKANPEKIQPDPRMMQSVLEHQEVPQGRIHSDAGRRTEEAA